MKQKPVIMVLGVFHFRYIDDVLEPHRQNEIKELVKRIAKFRPDKVCVERVVERDEELNAEFTRFLSSDFELPTNEIYQIAFRVARQLGHQRIYATDWMDMDEADKDRLERGFEEVESKQPALAEEAKDWNQQLHKMLRSGTVLEMIRNHNEEEFNAFDHQYYIRYRARKGDFPDYVGPFWLRWWYQRNLIIYSNVARLAEAGERVLVMYGSGHNYLLKQFIRESGLFELEDLGLYLG